VKLELAKSILINERKEKEMMMRGERESREMMM